MNTRKVVAGVCTAILASSGLVAQPALAAGTYTPIPQSQMKFVFADSVEETGEGTNGSGALVLDGDEGSYWHTKWSSGKDPLPHNIVIDLGKEHADLGRVSLLPRQSSNGSGRVNEYTVQVSTDATCATADTWSDAAWTDVAQGAVEAQPASGKLTAVDVDFAPVAARCVNVVYNSSWGGNDTAEEVATLAEFNAATVADYEPTPDPTTPVDPEPTPPVDPDPTTPAEPDPGAAITIPDPEGAFTITDGSVTATLRAEFPQIVKYVVGDKTLAGNTGEALTEIHVNESPQSVTVTDLTKAADSSEYTLDVADLGASIKVKVSVADGTLTWAITDIADPNGNVDRVMIPGLNLVTVAGADAGSIVTAVNTTNRSVSSDTTIDVATAKPGTDGNGWFAAVNDEHLAAGLLSNGLSDDEDQAKDGSDVKHRWLVRTDTDGNGAKIGTVSPGSWVIYGTQARGEGKIGREELPFAQVRVVADANDDGVIDWQDSATATRELMVAAGLPHGFTDTKDLPVQRIPFNIVSQATHPFLRTLDDTKRISLATDNLGQKVLLKGYQAEGHDSAQGDYGSHYNDRAGGFDDLVTMLKASEDFNAIYGVHVNATESYSEAQCFHDGEHDAAGTGANYENPCTLNMPPAAAWGWMNQAYYMNSVQDLTSMNLVNRFQNFRDELTAAGVEDNLPWLYFDVYYRTGWLADRVAEEMQDQGWQIGSEWAYSMPDHSNWSHWANDEAYGAGNKGLNSLLVRYIQNSWRDTWNPDALLSHIQLREYEGWTGQQNYDAFRDNIWQRNLAVKFLQQSDIRTYEQATGDQLGKATFYNGTEVTTPVAAPADGWDLSYNRTISYDGKTVFDQGKYLLPWGDTQGVGTASAGGTKMYHFNPEGGDSTWELTGAFAGVDSFTLYELTDQGRANPTTVSAHAGSVTLSGVKENTPYVLYPNEAPTQADPVWGEGTNFSDPGFYAGDLEAEGYTVTGNVTTDTYYREKNNLGSVAILGEGASSLAQTMKLPAGSYSAWAWVEIAPGQERPVAVSVSGDAKAVGNQAEVAGVPTTTITASTAQNATASDEKKATYFQRVRVTFETGGGDITFKVAAGDGSATVAVDDLRVVKYTAPKDPKPTDKTVFFDDLESVDTGYWPFVTGKNRIGGDAQTQMAEKHAPYSQAGWYGKDRTGKVVEGGKKTDNVLDGEWSLLSHEEGGGQVTRTIPASVKFEPAKTYRVSLDYQNVYAGEYELVVGRDYVDNGEILSTVMETLAVPEAHGTGAGGEGTQVLAIEFTTSTLGDYWFGFNKIGSSPASDLTVDNIRVELIDDNPATIPGNADPQIRLDKSSVSEGDSVTASTNTTFFEQGELTNVTTAVTGSEDWTISTPADPAGENIAQEWVVDIPRGSGDGVLTYTVRYDVDNDGKFREVSATTKVKVVRAVRDGANYLSDLPWTDEVNGWGPVERDLSNGEQNAGDGLPITMKGVEHDKGIGMHSMSGATPANVTFDLGGRCSTMTATVGINDTQPKGSVQFQVLGDGEVIFGPTQTLRKGTTVDIDLDITGVKSLQLQVLNGGDGNGNDHANWADAIVTCSVSDGTPPDPEPTPDPDPEPTPEPEPEPTPSTCEAAKPPARLSAATARFGEASGDVYADVWAVNGEGAVHFYKGNTGGISHERVVECGFAGTSLTKVTDVNGDNRADFLVRHTNGQLYFYYSTGDGYLQKGEQAGHGWNGMDNIIYAGRLGSGEKEYVVARQVATGDLYRYELTSRGLTNTTKIGHGWSGMKHIVSVGNIVSHGFSDVIGITDDGRMIAYEGLRDGRISAVGQIGHGWSPFVNVFVPGDLTGDAHMDLIGIRDDGTMFRYVNTAKGHFQPAVQIGHGWGAMRITN